MDRSIQHGFQNLHRALQETIGGEEIYNACIEGAPGLNANHRDAEELALRWDFFDCVVDEMLVIIEDEDPSSPAAEDGSTTVFESGAAGSSESSDGNMRFRFGAAVTMVCALLTALFHR